MTDRERWIVYPLLFLALGAALRDKLAKQTRAKEIVCEQLYVVDAEGRPLATLAGNELQLGPQGYLTAGLVEAGTLVQRGKPVVTSGVGQGLSLPQLLRLLPQLQMPRLQAAPPTPSPAPPGEGPRLLQPRTPPTEGDAAPERGTPPGEATPPAAEPGDSV